MLRKAIFVFVAVLMLAGAAAAQTPLTGVTTCGKADIMQKVDIPDRPGHAFVISQVKCADTKPFVYGAAKGKDGVSTITDEITGDSSRTRGYYVETLDNGDNVHYSFEGTAKLKAGALVSAEIKWTILRATGKSQGITGQGTCKGTGTPEGGVTWDCTGSYQAAKK
jgi:hypothetical protein